MCGIWVSNANADFQVHLSVLMYVCVYVCLSVFASIVTLQKSGPTDRLPAIRWKEKKENKWWTETNGIASAWNRKTLKWFQEVKIRQHFTKNKGIKPTIWRRWVTQRYKGSSENRRERWDNRLQVHYELLNPLLPSGPANFAHKQLQILQLFAARLDLKKNSRLLGCSRL